MEHILHYSDFVKFPNIIVRMSFYEISVSVHHLENFYFFSITHHDPQLQTLSKSFCEIAPKKLPELSLTTIGALLDTDFSISLVSKSFSFISIAF